jgi:UDP-N-acetylmuramoyl-tripeptide--D-alanyl-D-alanine ligase
MIPLGLAAIAGVLDARLVAAADRVDVEVAEVMTDTRVPAQRAALFFALRTEHADGHDHAAAAAAAGAVAVVVERDRRHRRSRSWSSRTPGTRSGVSGVTSSTASGCRVVAITGSYGKTTVKDLTAAALSAGRSVTASRASFNNELGVPLTMLAVSTRHAGARRGGRSAQRRATSARWPRCCDPTSPS